MSKKYTMERMAELAEMPYSTYRAIEKGDRSANNENMIKISKALGVKPEDIFLPSRFTIRDITIKEVK